MEDSSNRSTLEEEIYWQNFQFAQFFLKLSNDFHHHITLPKKFSDLLRNNLPEKLVLKVNRVSWNVGLEKGKDEFMLHGDEWQKFINAYSLKKRDVLLFKYNRRECFEVILFDGSNLCEKEGSYFISKENRRDKNMDDDDEDYNLSRKSKENSSKGHITSTSKNRNGKSLVAKTACTIDFSDEPDDEEDKTEESYDEENSTSEEFITTSQKGMIAREINSQKRKRNAVKKSTRKKSIGVYEVRYESNRRQVTAVEIQNALHKAKEAAKLCINPFVRVMRPSSVYRRFFMTIPAEWKPMEVFRRKQDIILKVEEKTWVCRVTFNKTAIGFQSAAWRDFVRDNFLEEYDVCLFVPSGLKDERYVLDVSIFRVVSEVVPPTLV